MQRCFTLILVFAACVSGATRLLAADSWSKLERKLYVTDKSGISVYDIDNGHKLVRKIEIPETGDYNLDPA